jgi:hypothetical protein
VGGHPLVGHGVEEARQLTPVRQPQRGLELQQRLEDEAPARHLGVRKGQTFRAVLEVAEQENVDVDRARAVSGAGLGPAELALDCLASIEQPLGVQRRLDPQARVEEVRLVGYLTLRRGLVDGGRCDGFDAALGERRPRRPEVAQAIALV